MVERDIVVSYNNLCVYCTCNMSRPIVERIKYSILFYSILFYSILFYSNDAHVAWPVWTPGTRLAGFIKKIG